MGIRFFCPSCDDRMNVKSFLAGKRGICPKCEAKFDIPMASDPRAEQKKKKSGKLKLPTAAVASVANSTQDADDAADAANDIAGELFIPTLPAPQLAPQMESEVNGISRDNRGPFQSMVRSPPNGRRVWARRWIVDETLACRRPSCQRLVGLERRMG